MMYRFLITYRDLFRPLAAPLAILPLLVDLLKHLHLSDGVSEMCVL